MAVGFAYLLIADTNIDGLVQIDILFAEDRIGKPNDKVFAD